MTNTRSAAATGLPPNINRAIDEAIAVAELTGPQTGSRRTQRGARYDAPADRPVVEFTNEEEDRDLDQGDLENQICRVAYAARLAQIARDNADDMVDENALHMAIDLVAQEAEAARALFQQIHSARMST
ncbi:hypothetical protein MWN34_12640 [Ancylobacter sp. 6x-1]|uniref:Uncharacterized protein n=1 Tax=Ancylobacter crimeensis TaxID=2579147 RepID=A0ABT0DCT1_9HYPH|nr:hypothetical protein [Ancylobacter crimeensis]MCK0197759.1 hypothetical protein [Ancylobacter crimeensis]